MPNVRKAVRWSSPFYGIEGQGWFLAFHCFTKYTRYFHIHEDDQLDEELVASWLRQASGLLGDPLF